jgi:O-acetyl-ADP-ribose deacetylase (regulator of RNase III)
VVKTKAGKLKCKVIFHIITPSHKNEGAGLIDEVLCEAEKDGIQSISFPALGTG